MMKIRFKRGHFAKLLGFTDQQLTAADKLPELKALGGGPDSYQPRHLSAYRRVLDRHPGREPLRRQLFLNFKGGTGKTSLSVAYAYRLAEMGHRVLLIDLDSQGHATQHLGLAGENLERTVFDTLVGGVPLEDVIIGTVLAEFDVVPATEPEVSSESTREILVVGLRAGTLASKPRVMRFSPSRPRRAH